MRRLLSSIVVLLLITMAVVTLQFASIVTGVGEGISYKLSVWKRDSPNTARLVTLGIWTVGWCEKHTQGGGDRPVMYGLSGMGLYAESGPRMVEMCQEYFGSSS